MNLHITQVDDNSNSGGGLVEHPSVAGKGAHLVATGVLTDFCDDNGIMINDETVSIDSITLSGVTADHFRPPLRLRMFIA